MKILVLTAFIAAVVSDEPRVEVDNQTQWPWLTGKLYRYDVVSHTTARLEEGESSGSVFKAHLIIRVLAPGRLLATLQDPKHAMVHPELCDSCELPEDLKYEPVHKLDQVFEISLEGGRVRSLNLPTTLSLSHENLLKGLIGALQVDLSTHRHIRSSQFSYDKETQQGMFSKMETDVTGDCETLYTVSPVAAEWRRELPAFESVEDPIEITKSKNYGHCHHRVAYHFGVPEGSEWTGTAHNTHEEQFIRRGTVSRILAGKQGPIYKCETTSTVHVHPHLYGKQKAEVKSYIRINLVLFEKDTGEAWPQLEGGRLVSNLLYSMTTKQITIGDSSSSSSSSSSESKEEHQNVQDRLRRSARKIDSVNKMITKRSDDDISSSSSSSSESQQYFVNDEPPRKNEPAYAALYLSPQSRVDKKQNSMNAQKLVQDIAQQLQNPNNMPKSDLLSKFNILVRILASMSYDQISQTSRSIEVAKSSNNKVKSDMWMIYRDGVAQTGTLPAFQLIKNWIQTKKIREEEAAQVVASLPSSLRYPSKEIMIEFFNLAMSEEVRQQVFLNTTALITATRLIHMAQVNNESAHNFYPTHMYGRLSRKHDPFVQMQILPRLSQELSLAIQREDSNKAQVCIKAIGNLGHRSILQVFAPYLEGKVPVTTYLRREMVNNLEVLAFQRDKHVRSALYNILKNTAEHYEVRVAAIHNILMTKPTTSMMMVMAHMTHIDPSMHVRAALKSCIESTAELKNPRLLDLWRTAQAVKWMLSKEEYGIEYSTKDIKDSYDKDYELGILSSLSYTGSHDSLLPKFLRYSRGWNNPNKISTSFSSVQQFIEHFQYLMSHMRSPGAKSKVSHKYSAEKISEILNIKRDTPIPLEAAFYVNLMNQARYFTFTKYDLEQLVRSLSQYFENLANGIERHYTKVFNQAQVSIMFPVASGLPFIYKYKEPTVVHIQGKLKGHVEYPTQEKQHYSASVAKEIYFTYARNLDGSVGFMDTLVDHYISAGVVNKLQINVPIKLDMQMKSGEYKVSVEPLRPEQDQTILHYSVWPYTTCQKKDSLTTVSQDPNTKVITRQHKVSAVDHKFGQLLGTIYHLQGYSYSSDYQNLGTMWRSDDWLANIVHAFCQKDMALTHYNLKYLGKQSQNKRVTYTAVFDTFHNLKEKAQQEFTASNMADVSPNSDARRQEMVKRVASGINNAKARVVDMSATFEGPQQLQYVLTFAMANSMVDPKIQYAFFAGKTSPQQGSSQINGVLKVNKPEITTLNFLDALNKEMKSPFEADIKFDKNGNIQVRGYTERSKKFVELLQQHLWAKICKDDITRNNLYQDACHKPLVLAHTPDTIKASMTYKEVSPVIRAMIYQTFKLLEHKYFWHSQINPMKITADGKLEIDVQISPLEKTLSLALNTRLGEVRMRNLPISRGITHALAVYTPFKPSERLLNYYTSHQFKPFCTVDGNKVKTFSNRSYEYMLSPTWHVVMQNDDDMAKDKLVVLARRPSEKQQEIYISYKSKNGKHLEIELLPAEGQKYNVRVNTNGKKLSEGDFTMYWDDVEQEPLLQYYTGSDGVMMLTIREDCFRALYDGQRLVILSSELRKKNTGLCGCMSGSPSQDYMTPYGIVDKPELFGSTFALKDETMDEKTLKLQEEAKKVAYQSKIEYTAIHRSDSEWSNAMRSSSSSSSSEEEGGSHSVYRSRSYLKVRGECHVQEQVQYYENHGEICISTLPVHSCQTHCRGVDNKIEPVQVICRPKIDQQFVAYRDLILQGESPKVSGVPLVKQFRVPTTCTA